ncbi:CDP-diacylglycerol diphosphatase, partial [Methylorubrum rhodesianum]|uniref:CDP-diacylglycerol diphosphatase n=1 Tax=Methylorubrum rhodesianum TaxID=29427 RepID=UPI003D2CB3CF
SPPPPRHSVSDALKGRLSVDDVGLAVNSAGGRSQDQLHIHLDCVVPSVKKALQQYASTIGSTWEAMPIAVQGRRYFALRLNTDRVADFNPFAALSHLPGRRTSLKQVSLAMISLQANGGERLCLFGLPSPSGSCREAARPRLHGRVEVDSKLSQGV